MFSPTKTTHCIIHYATVEQSGKLLHLRDYESWKTLLRAATVRNYSPILELNVEDGQIPEISYHPNCRASFTMKRDLEKLAKTNPTGKKLLEKAAG